MVAPMRRRVSVRAFVVIWVLVAQALAPPTFPSAPARAAEAQLAARLARALDAKALHGARVGALARRCTGSEVIFARDADALLAPASNQKVFTALAALALFGPAHRFVTRVYADRLPGAEGEVGMLAVRGGGDPALTSEEWWRLSADLRRLGLRRVRGDIVLDDSTFEPQRWNPAWGDQSSRAYYPAIGSLMANYGAFTVEVRPGNAPGAPPRVSVDPPVDHFRVVNEATTAATGAAKTLQVERKAASEVERIIVSGRIPAGSLPEVVHRSVADPTAYAGAVLAMQLGANGIVVGGKRRAGSVPQGAVEVLAYEGKPLAEIVRLLMKYSNNGIAEVLVKAMARDHNGAAGSWTDGVAVMRQTLSSLGVGTEGFALLDGSGLAKGNRVSPRALVTALCRARSSFAFGPELVAALPISGHDGTLGKRGVAAGAVRAKTGLLAGATGLSGYATRRDGDEIAFSILVNGYRASDVEVMSAVDGFVNALVGWDER
jgi:D-alanyl-D-alanine carboxypeptidase/D-alanyl-D-alanine-endopeptidase (penicillin-binding protein 4)